MFCLKARRTVDARSSGRGTLELVDLQDYRRVIETWDEYNHRLCSWLERRGWEYCCDFPDHCWRWCKTVDAGAERTYANDHLRRRRKFEIGF